MTEQDGASSESEEATTDEPSTEDGSQASDGVEQGENGPSSTATNRETIEEIAEEPTGDVDEILSGMVGADSDGKSDSPVDCAVDPTTVQVDDEFIGTVEQTDTEILARGLALLQSEVDRLQTERQEATERAEDLESRLKRKQADFQNYKKRQQKRMEEEKQRATEDLVERLLDVRDNLARALDQDEGTDIRGGVESTLEQFNQELDRENVEIIEPAPGDEVDPNRHEVLVTIASAKQEDTIAELHRPGYEMAGKVLRPAQVAVSDGSMTEEAGVNDGADDTDRI